MARESQKTLLLAGGLGNLGVISSSVFCNAVSVNLGRQAIDDIEDALRCARNYQ